MRRQSKESEEEETNRKKTSMNDINPTAKNKRQQIAECVRLKVIFRLYIYLDVIFIL